MEKKLYTISELEKVRNAKDAAKEAGDWKEYDRLEALEDKMERDLLPEVGMKVTEHLWSDSHAYTIVEVINDNKCVVARNRLSDDCRGMEDLTKYVTNDLYEDRVTISRRKNTRSWYIVGRPTKWGEIRYTLGYWHEYYDPEF